MATEDTEGTETGMEDMGIAEGSAGTGITATVDSATTIREIVVIAETVADTGGGDSWQRTKSLKVRRNVLLV